MTTVIAGSSLQEAAERVRVASKAVSVAQEEHDLAIQREKAARVTVEEAWSAYNEARAALLNAVLSEGAA